MNCKTNWLTAACLLCVSSGLSAVAPCTECLTTKHYIRRSDSRQKPLQLVGDYHYTHLRDTDSWYGLLSVTPTYRASFRYEDIADVLLGSERCRQRCGACTSIPIQGSAVTDRASNAWLADYFYLPRNYNSAFSIKPTIKNSSVMIDLFLGSANGLYLQIFGPIVHSRWNLRFREENLGPTQGGCCEPIGICYADTEGTCTRTPMNHSCGYFSQAEYEGSKLVRSFRDYMSGAIPQASDDENNNIKWNSLKYAKMLCGERKETGFADLRAELGYDFLNCREYRLALNIQGAAPTGKKQKPCFLFDAAIGNGNHWELGGGLNGCYRLWEHDEERLALDFVFDANVTYMFKSRQCRTFDLKCESDSAYMLAAKFGPNPEVKAPEVAGSPLTDAQVGWRENGRSANRVAQNTVSLPNPNRRFALEYTPVANLSTVAVDVSVKAHVDIVAMLHYTCGNTFWDLGYNFWARSCENIDHPKPACNTGTLYEPALKETWALKGDARMFGYQNFYADDGGEALRPDSVTAIPLSATQSNASIYSGTNEVLPSNLVENNASTLANASGHDVNLHVDNAEYAFTYTPLDVNNQCGPLGFSCDISRYEEGSVPLDDPGDYLRLVAATDNIMTSSKPIFLSCSDLALTRLRGVSHTVFSHLSYGCTGDKWDPYLGIGTSIEFGNVTDTCCDSTLCCTSCCESNCLSGSSNCCNNQCIDVAVSQWSIWLKGGIAFR